MTEETTKTGFDRLKEAFKNLTLLDVLPIALEELGKRY